jgi:hypothetical protein
MTERLLPCPSCARHVRASEEACPFCAGELPASRTSQPLPRSPATRLSRAALYAFGASAAVVAACGGSTGSTVADGGTTDGGDESRAMPVYGGPVVDGGEDAPILVDAAYGGPPQDGAADAESDSSPAPLYGAPPP